MLVGYAGVSTDDQDLTLQRTALKQAGCKRIYQEKVSGAKRDRPALTRMLDQLREGDVVVVARLDRLARSTRDLLDIAELLKEGGAGLRSRRGAVDGYNLAGRQDGADGLRRHGGVRAGPHPPANQFGAGLP